MVLVTGATGLLGRVIVLELIKSGKKVRACKRPDSDLADVLKSYRFYTPHADFFFNQIEWVHLDFENHQSLYNALKDVQEVYHCAAKLSFDPNDRKEVLKTGILFTRNLLHACMYLSVKKFLFVSSAATLHISKNDLESQLESDRNRKKFPPYALSKYVCEKMVWDAHQRGLSAVIINPGMIIGTGNWKKKNSPMPEVFAKSRFTFAGGTSCIDVRDVAATAIRLMDENIFGERFCIASDNISYKDIATQIRAITGKKKPIVCSEFFLKCLQPFRIFLGLIDNKANLLTRENIKFVSERKYHHSKKLKEKVKCDFYPIEESIRFHYENYTKYTGE